MKETPIYTRRITGRCPRARRFPTIRTLWRQTCREFKLGAGDVKAAFRYYIDHLNQGRPLILVGYSQGTMALIEQIKTEFGNNETLRNNLVAAYLIGHTVTDNDLALAGLSAAQGEADTGVVITYNTQSATSVGGPMLMAGANCINPLNWKTDGTPALASENLGHSS